MEQTTIFARCEQLAALGMKFNGSEYIGSGITADFNVHSTEISCITNNEWNLIIDKLTAEKARREK